MLKKWLRSLGAVALAGFLAGPVLAKSPESAAAEASVGKPPVWSIEKPDGGTIYMFGSVHMLPKDKEWRSPALEAALEAADVVVFEIDIEKAQSEAMGLMMQGMNPPGVTLSSMMTPEQIKTVEAGAAKIGVPMTMLDPMKPWMAFLTLSSMYAVNQGLDPNAGVEMVLKSEASAKGKSFDYLETVAQQIGLFTGLTDAQAIEALVIGARDMIEKPNLFPDLLAAWGRGDVAEIDRLMNASMTETPELAKALLEDRNANWVRKIQDVYMKDGKTYLIVGGAAHFAGEFGVQTLLRAEGVTVVGP